ncbi:hypothetical protein JKP88DRAFT_292477 [Tribonema minus]|uniref:EsV-1-7 n=1 Tax=Tribonema minus TaxID=303371 RepID=A0A835ZIM1_9STRA|nr:hypothetical protein JKP88DRAFT_292477 [Tribonema minus]
MVVVLAGCCNADGCDKQPSFGFIGEKPKFCATHKLGGMTDVKNKRCEAAGCGKTPNFAEEGQKPRFCSAHKLPDHVNVKGPFCHADNCRRRRALSRFCVDHLDTPAPAPGIKVEDDGTWALRKELENLRNKLEERNKRIRQLEQQLGAHSLTSLRHHEVMRSSGGGAAASTSSNDDATVAPSHSCCTDGSASGGDSDSGGSGAGRDAPPPRSRSAYRAAAARAHAAYGATDGASSFTHEHHSDLPSITALSCSVTAQHKYELSSSSASSPGSSGGRSGGDSSPLHAFAAASPRRHAQRFKRSASEMLDGSGSGSGSGFQGGHHGALGADGGAGSGAAQRKPVFSVHCVDMIGSGDVAAGTAAGASRGSGGGSGSGGGGGDSRTEFFAQLDAAQQQQYGSSGSVGMPANLQLLRRSLTLNVRGTSGGDRCDEVPPPQQLTMRHAQLMMPGAHQTWSEHGGVSLASGGGGGAGIDHGGSGRRIVLPFPAAFKQSWR